VCSHVVPSQRGINRNCQVDDVPRDLYPSLPNWVFVRRHIQKMVVAYSRSAECWCYRDGVELSSEISLNYLAVNTLIGWSGA
jgi:hypothetical protein